jgi:hypothetical protein
MPGGMSDLPRRAAAARVKALCADLLGMSEVTALEVSSLSD